MANYIITPVTDDFYGIKKIESSIDTLICFLMPRNKVKGFVECEESQKAGVYFLYNTEQTKVYVGQSGTSSKDRLEQHLKKKDWWTNAIVFTTKTDDITPTHAKIIESRFIDLIDDLGLEKDNDTGSKEPIVKSFYDEDCNCWVNQIIQFTKLLNLKLFVRDKLEEIDSKNPQNYPIKYSIFGKTYDFSTVYNVLVDQCERILEIKGSDALIKGLEKVNMKSIIFNEKNDSDTPYKLSNGITVINKHGSLKQIKQKTKAISKVFPDFKIEFIYPKD